MGLKYSEEEVRDESIYFNNESKSYPYSIILHWEYIFDIVYNVQFQLIVTQFSQTQFLIDLMDIIQIL